jgi:putative tryptophan/tyrosine transport system substrate-binding protein
MPFRSSREGAGMRRRQFISVIGGAAAWSVTARAQQIERPRRIGILLGSYSSTDQAGQVRIATLLKTLRELGWEDGRNLRIDYRWGAGNTEQNIKFAAELVQSAPDAIIATSDPVVAKLHRLTSDIPIIFTQTSEPVESGIVASLARPGGNMTGFQNFEPAIGGKWLEVLGGCAWSEERRCTVQSGCRSAHSIPAVRPERFAIAWLDGDCR